MAQNVTIMGASYSAVPAVTLPKTGGGTARFDDATVTTATASDVASGKVFIAADGTITTGTGSGGGGSVTQDANGFIVLPDTGGGGAVTLKEGVIRPDAELVQSWTYDKYIVEDEGATLPSYSTTSATLKASASLDSVSVNFTDYDYMLVMRCLAIPKYVPGTSHGAGQEEYCLQPVFVEMSYKHSRDIVSLDGSQSVSSYFVTATTTHPLYAYWNSSTGFKTLMGATSGASFTITSPAVLASSITVNSPVLRVVGNSSYFSATYYNALEDIRYQYVIELWRAAKGSLNLDGWGVQQEHMHMLGNIIDDNGKLD